MRYQEQEKRFVAFNEENQEVGEITFQTVGDNILIIDHTYVDQNYRGQQIANKLVKLVVDKAIQDEKLVIPLCPFAAKEFQRHPEYQEIQKKIAQKKYPAFGGMGTFDINNGLSFCLLDNACC